jgi:hypothetical protein
MATFEEVGQVLKLMAQISGREFSPAAANLLLGDLSEYPPDDVLRALNRCRRELRTFPSLADIIERIDDGRPGPEEAWALLPQSEDETCVWTDEMREAYGVARTLLDNPVQARLAFVETYRKAIADARANRIPVRWSASMGHDPQQRARAIKQAVEQGRLTQAQSAALLPEPVVTETKLLAGPTEEPAPDPERVREILANLLADKGMS